MPDDPESRSTLRRPSRLPYYALGAAAIAAVAAVLVRTWLDDRGPPVTATAGPTAAPPATATPPPAAVSTSPADARALLESASANPLYRREIANDLPRRAALVLAALVHGESPRSALAGLAPAQRFSVLQRGSKAVISPASYARYDAFADAVASVDPAKLALAYRALHGPVEAALRAGGYPDARLDEFAARALRRIAAAPVLDGELEVVPHGAAAYAFADPKLEERAEVEKHLLRMGPRNTRLLQEKARALLQALELPAAGR